MIANSDAKHFMPGYLDSWSNPIVITRNFTLSILTWYCRLVFSRIRRLHPYTYACLYILSERKLRIAASHEVCIDFSLVHTGTQSPGQLFRQKKNNATNEYNVDKLGRFPVHPVCPTFATGKKRMAPRVTIWLPGNNEIVPQCYSKTERPRTIELISCRQNRIPLKYERKNKNYESTRTREVSKPISDEILSRKLASLEKNAFVCSKKIS